MKIITHEDILNLKISPKTCMQWVDEVLLNKDKAILPAKISLIPFEGSFINVMPSLIKPINTSGVKVVTRFKDRFPLLDSKLILLDSMSGKFLAIMDANWITAMRTGAVAAHSINLFSKKNFETIGLIGLGNTARATLIMLSEFIKDRPLKIRLLKYKGQEELFKRRFQNYKNFIFEEGDSYEDIISNSDTILSSATYFESDICDDKYYNKGITVIPIHTRGFQNCDLFFDKVFADDKGHVCHFKYFDKFKQFAQTSDVVLNKCRGRVNDEERIIVYNIGISLHDINFAYHIYNLVDITGHKSKIDFKEPKEKFWV